MLSTAGGDKPSSKNMVAAPPRDRLGNVPLIGVPEEARRGGPTSPGMGGNPESTMPGEDALLAGLIERQDVRPRSKKERESGPSFDGSGGAVRSPSGGARASVPAKVEVPTLDAPPSAPKVASAVAVGDVTSDSFSEGTTRKLAGAANVRANAHESDTFASQESDARRASRKTNKLAVPIALGLLAVIAALSFMAYRVRPQAATTSAAPGPQPVETSVAVSEPATAATNAPPATANATVTATSAPVATALAAVPLKAAPSAGHRGKPITTASATPSGGRPSTIATIPATPPPTPSPPSPTKAVPKDDSFVRGL